MVISDIKPYLNLLIHTVFQKNIITKTIFFYCIIIVILLESLFIFLFFKNNIINFLLF